MRLLNVFNLAILITGFLFGYFIRDLGLEKKQGNLAKDGVDLDLAVKYSAKPEIAAKKPENLRIMSLTSKSHIINTALDPVDQAVENVEQHYNDDMINWSAGEILVSIASLDAQHKTLDEIRDSQAFQQLASLLSTDAAARLLVLDQFMKVSGTPMGQMLSQALASSGNVAEIPQVREAAVKLLRNGSVAQRLDALQLLGQTSHDQDTRSLVLDILRKDSQESPQLAIAAMSTLTRQGVVTQAAQKEVSAAVSPLTHNPDPQVRQNSLQLLSQWVVHDISTLQTFTEATYDIDPGVRNLAIAALGQGGFAYESVRDPLLSVLQNPHEDQSVKVVALQALENFPLDDQALQIYQAQLANNVYLQPGSEASNKQ